MPITITPAPPHNVIGPGIPLTLNSSVFGPFPTGTQFQVSFLQLPPLENVWFQESYLTTSSDLTVFPMTTPGLQRFVSASQPQAGDQVPLRVSLNEPSGQVDTGAGSFTWDPTSGLATQAVGLPVGSGGLTDSQAQQLDDVHAAVAPAISLDALLLDDLTGGVPTDFVAAQLPNAIFGVIVRLTSIPPELSTISADANYWRTTLAVVQIFRGSDLWVRAPIHTSNRIVPLPQEGLATSAAENELTAWLLQLSLQVTFAPGVLGEVFLMKYP